MCTNFLKSKNNIKYEKKKSCSLACDFKAITILLLLFKLINDDGPKKRKEKEKQIK